jgi:hypothetical protein
VFSIWARNPNDLEKEQQFMEEYEASDGYDVDVVAEIARITTMPLNDQVYPRDETLVYSEVIAKGLTLRQKHFEKDIEFDIPLKRL